MTSSSTTRSFEEILEECNASELVQFGRKLGIRLDGNLPTTVLKKMAIGESDEVTSSIDSWRKMIMCFLLDNWAQISSQLTCPAKSGNLDACFGCEDAQVASCVVDNKKILPLIRRYENMPDMPSIDNVNLNLDELRGIGVVFHKRLAESLEKEGIRLWENDMQKTSWLTQDPGARAATLLQGLTAYRSSKGGQQPAVVQQQAFNPPTQMFPPPAAAAQNEDDREPVNKGKKTTNGKTTLATDLEPVLASIAALNEKIDKLSNNINTLGQMAVQGNTTTAMLLRLQQTVLGLLSIFGQNILGAGTKDVITMGDQEGGAAMQAVQSARVQSGEVKA